MTIKWCGWKCARCLLKLSWGLQSECNPSATQNFICKWIFRIQLWTLQYHIVSVQWMMNHVFNDEYRVNVLTTILKLYCQNLQSVLKLNSQNRWVFVGEVDQEHSKTMWGLKLARIWQYRGRSWGSHFKCGSSFWWKFSFCESPIHTLPVLSRLSCVFLYFNFSRLVAR